MILLPDRVSGEFRGDDLLSELLTMVPLGLEGVPSALASPSLGPTNSPFTNIHHLLPFNTDPKVGNMWLATILLGCHVLPYRVRTQTWLPSRRRSCQGLCPQPRYTVVCTL